VHNVPFKWCNHDLEAMFAAEPGYLDAQLLFHENGRSKVRGRGARWQRLVHRCCEVSQGEERQEGHSGGVPMLARVQAGCRL
jgi:hypothetical protein